jgi:hypothetical protein
LGSRPPMAKSEDPAALGRASSNEELDGLRGARGPAALNGVMHPPEGGPQAAFRYRRVPRYPTGDNPASGDLKVGNLANKKPPCEAGWRVSPRRLVHP